MKLLFYYLILQVFQTATPFNISLDDEMNMILDILNSDHKPTSLAINVCWNRASKRNFIVKLKRLPKAFQFVDSIEDVKETSFKNDLLIFIDISCIKSTVFLEKADDLKMFGAPYRWLMITKLTTLKDIILKIKKLNIPIHSEIILPVKENNGFTIRMPYKIQANNSKVNWEYYGIWTPNHRLKISRTMSIPISMRRKNLGGLPIARSTVLTDDSSATLLNSMKNINIDTLSKANYRQITPLYDFMNATNINIFRGTWGYLINNTWNGMIGSLVRGEADLGGTVTFITTQRLQVLDYLSYPSPPTAKFVFREPSLSYQNNLFLLPFKPAVWICIFVLIIILAVIVFINAKWEKEKMMATTLNYETVNETTLRPNVSDIAIMIIGAISQQGSSTELKGTLGRVVMFLLFIAFVFLYTSYSANIVVLLQSTSNQIRTLADLYNSKLELGSEDTPYNRHLFSTAKEPIRMAIYKNKIAPRGSKSNFMSLDEGVKKLQTEPFAFNMFLGTGYKAIENYFYEHEKCGLQEIEYIQENKPWQTCRKYSPYKEIYKVGLLRIHEHGLNDRENRRVYGKKPVCSVRGGSFGSVNMMDFYPALLMLLYGMILSCILLFLEIWYQRRTHSTIFY